MDHSRPRTTDLSGVDGACFMHPTRLVLLMPVVQINITVCGSCRLFFPIFTDLFIIGLIGAPEALCGELWRQTW